MEDWNSVYKKDKELIYNILDWMGVCFFASYKVL
mgnify:CR=1 FL=1